MRNPNRFKSLPWFAAAAFIPSSGFALNLTWDGGGNGAWTTGTNWVGDPTGTPTLGIGSVQTFYAPGTTNLTTFLGTGGRVIGTLNLDDNADSDVSVRFYSVNAASGGTDRSFTFDVASGTAAINIDSGAAGNFTLGVSGGNMILNDHLVITHNGSGNLTINQPITGQSTTQGITKSGSGMLTLSGNNAFSGGLTLTAGTLNINRSSALGFAAAGGVFLVSDGTIDNTSAGAVTKFNHLMTIDGDFAFTGTQDLDLGTGAVTLGTAAGTSRTITANAKVLTIGGIIANGTTANSLIKNGDGTLSLTAANAYTGTTVIKAGTLKINTTTTLASSSSIVVGDTGSSGAILNAATAGLTVGSTQTIAGIGSVNATGQTVAITGALAPGNSAGTLSFTAKTVNLANATHLNFELNPADFTVGGGINDLVSVTGNLTLDGILNLTATSGDFLSASLGDTWRLFNYSGSLTNNAVEFGAMPGLGGGLGWGIDTVISGQVNLTVIPEPSAVLLGSLCFLALLRRRR